MYLNASNICYDNILVSILKGIHMWATIGTKTPDKQYVLLLWHNIIHGIMPCTVTCEIY